MWALLRKEFLENVRWLPLAMLLTSTMTIMPVYHGWIADISPMISNFLFGTSLLAIGCGLLQSIPDERNSARAYLLHRGVSAGQVFWAKSLVSFLLISVAVAVPLALCAWWLARRGVSSAPGRPIQMLPPALIAFCAWTFYPTVLLIIYRPARWLGSRVAPIMVPILLMWYGHSQLDTNASVKQIVTVSLLSLGVAVVMLVAAKLAYVDLARLPAASARAHRAPATGIVLMASMLGISLVFSMLVDFVTGLGGSSPIAYYNTYVNANDGQMWLVRYRHEWQADKKSYDIKILSGAPLVGEGMPDVAGPVPADFKVKYLPHLLLDHHSFYILSSDDIAYRSCNSPLSNERYSALLDSRGYILLYERMDRQRLAKIIGRDGFRDPNGDWGQPLTGVLSIQDNPTLDLVADRRGVYMLDEETGQMSTVLEESIERAKLWAGGVDKPLRLFVATGKQLLVYEVRNKAGVVIPFSDEERTNLVGPFQFERIDQFELPPRLAQLPMLDVDYRGPGHLLLHGHGGVGAQGVGTIGYLKPGSSAMEVFSVSAPPETYAVSSTTLVMAAVMKPPAPALSAPLITYLTAGKRQHKSLAEVAFVPSSSLPWTIALFVLQGIVAMVLTMIVARRRALSNRATLVWCALALGLGWAVPLTVLAYYPRIVRDVCSHCSKSRRVDLALCEHCQGTWERPQRQGVEIIEREFESMSAVTAGSFVKDDRD